MPRSLFERVPVRDGLAGERTVLAAERTLLAYVRTGFAFFVAGLTGPQLTDEPALVAVCYGLAALSIVVFIAGVARFIRSLRETRRMLHRLAQDENQQGG